MTTAIIDYGSGNLHSAKKAFELATQQAGLSEGILLTNDPDVVRNADRVVLPGVGAFADCRRGLDEIAGMVDAMREAVLQKGKPFLGICVGMQLLATRGLEHTTTQGLDWIGGDVEPINPSDPALKVPHMGWNTLEPARSHAILDNIPTGDKGLHAYFVHSYQLKPTNDAHVIARTIYGGPVVAVVGRDNIVGTQFHPEKSQKLGLALIANFMRWTP
jgi:imidazole glycerol-phosphate synthase subunit HisH